MSSDIVIPEDALQFNHSLSVHHIEQAAVELIAQAIRSKLKTWDGLRSSLELVLTICRVVEQTVKASVMDPSIKPDKQKMVLGVMRELFPVMSDVEILQLKSAIEVLHSRGLITKTESIARRAHKFFLEKGNSNQRDFQYTAKYHH